MQTEAARHQRDRYAGDPWDETIRAFIASRNSVSVEEILLDALHMDVGRWGQSEMNRVARCLQSFGWMKKRINWTETESGPRRPRRYFRPGQEDGQTNNVTPLKVVT
jgi:hypothetical protein